MIKTVTPTDKQGNFTSHGIVAGDVVTIAESRGRIMRLIVKFLRWAKIMKPLATWTVTSIESDSSLTISHD